MKELRELLTLEPAVNGVPLYPSVKELATKLVELPANNNKFGGNAASANAALNAIMRGERPFTAAIKELVVELVQSRVAEGPDVRGILERLEQLPTSERRPKQVAVEAEFAAALQALDRASDVLMIVPDHQAGISEPEAFRQQIFRKLGLYQSAEKYVIRDKVDIYARARITLVLGNAYLAKDEWDSFVLNAVGAGAGHPMGDGEPLAVDEVMKRLEALDQANLLRIYSVQPALCLAPVLILNPDEPSMEGWNIYYSPDEKTRSMRIPSEYLWRYSKAFLEDLESEKLPMQQRVRWADLDHVNIKRRAEGKALVLDLYRPPRVGRKPKQRAN